MTAPPTAALAALPQKMDATEDALLIRYGIDYLDGWNSAVEAMEQALAALPASGWRPIETAPKDCAKALLFGYPFGFRNIWIGKPHGFDATDATNWQPLPEPPAAPTPGEPT